MYPKAGGLVILRTLYQRAGRYGLYPTAEMLNNLTGPRVREYS
jgi:hypothetical protein